MTQHLGLNSGTSVADFFVKHALVVQWIELRTSKPDMGVRFPPRAPRKNCMKEPKPIWHSLGHVVLVAVYTSLVAQIMSNGSKWFGKQDTAWTPVAVLMLFVLSAAVTGTLVLGRPILMYLDGKKKEALQFFGYTVGWLFISTLVVFVIMIANRQ
jgi:hypothetical protein